MITKEDYEKSLAKLEDKEKLSILATENGAAFMTQYREALDKAKHDNGHIFILFYMKGCDGCNVVKYLITNNEDIKVSLSKYQILICDLSTTKTSLVQKYNVYSYPYCIIIDSNEKILKQKTGIKVLKGPENDILDWLAN